MKHRQLLLCLALLLATMVRAMSHLNALNGLSGGSVYAIFEDCYGLVWFGTSNGLDCYNGLTFRTYNATENRSQNIVHDIAQTTDGTLYAAMENGLFTPDRERSGTLRKVAADLYESVNTLIADGNTLYAGTESGLYIIQNDKIIDHIWLTKDHISARNGVNDLLLDGKNLWILGVNEVYRMDKASKKLQAMGVAQQHSLGSQLRVMALQAGRRLFLGTYNDGLFVLDLKTRQAKRFRDVGSSVINHMQVADGLLYVATDGAGVSVISLKDDRIARTYSTQNGLMDNSVYSFYRSKVSGNWFGYFRRGLSHESLSLPLFSYFEANGFSTRGLNVRSFCIDGNHIIIGTREGLYHYDGTAARYYSPSQLDGGSIITSVVKYAGQYYFATFDHGVYRLDPHSGQVARFGHESLVRTASFSRLLVSPNNELWMASNAGVFIYNAATDKLTRYDQHNSQLYDGYANSLLFDRQGRCWIGTHKGICVYNPVDGVLRSQGFPKDFKYNVSEPNFLLGLNNTIVSYSAEGLYRMDESLSAYGDVETNAVLNNSLISLVACDQARSQYWVGTEQGLFCFDQNFQRYQKFGKAYGLESSEFSTNACAIDGQHRLWLGTMNGLVVVDLSAVSKTRAAKVSILPTNITIGGHAISEKDELTMLRDHEIGLDFLWGTDELAFQPSLLDYADQRDVYYEYRIGTKGDWHTIRSGEKAECDGFTLGKNTLYLRVAGTDSATAYDVYVKPSVWLVLQILVIAILAFVLIVYWRNRTELAKVREDLAVEKEKYKRMQMNEEESECLYSRMKDYVQKNKSYLDSELKLSELAAALDCSTAKLSMVLNSYAKQNYYEFINAYRLEEFKRRLADERFSQYTLLALSEMCGFKKSSFFITFKKLEGMTPAEYVKKVRGK